LPTAVLEQPLLRRQEQTLGLLLEQTCQAQQVEVQAELGALTLQGAQQAQQLQQQQQAQQALLAQQRLQFRQRLLDQALQALQHF
jgi:hypothetical protein